MVIDLLVGGDLLLVTWATGRGGRSVRAGGSSASSGRALRWVVADPVRHGQAVVAVVVADLDVLRLNGENSNCTFRPTRAWSTS